MKLLKKSNRLVVALPTRQLANDSDVLNKSPSFDGGSQEEWSLDRWVVIGVSTPLCFAKTQHWEGRPKRLKQQELAYLLESYIPVDAEDLSVEMIMAPKQGFMVGINARELRDSLTARIPESTTPVCVCPTIFLALPEVLANCGDAKSLLTVIYGKEGSDLLVLQEERVLAWRWIDTQQQNVEELLHHIQVFGIDTVALCSFPNELEISLRQRLESLIDCNTVCIVSYSIDLEQAIIQSADQVASGVHTAPVNLLSGPLAPRNGHPVLGSVHRVAAVAAVGLLILIIGAIFLRSYRYEAAIAELEQQQIELFKGAFPNQPIPVGISNRLRSELRQLAGEKGTAAPLVPSIARPFESWLAALPLNPTYKIDRVDFRSDAIAAMTGSTETYEELEMLWKNLKMAGFIMPPPSATQAKGRISIRLELVPFAKNNESDARQDRAGE